MVAQNVFRLSASASLTEELHQLCFVATRLQLVEERSEQLVIEFYPC
jgi:hypothetical protein